MIAIDHGAPKRARRFSSLCQAVRTQFMWMNFGRAESFRFGGLHLSIAFAFTLGCGGGESGPPIVPVKGVVTLNNAPVEGAEVTFRVKDSPRASIGVTNDKGEYTLSTFNTDDGAIVGDNLVSIRQIPKEMQGVASISPEEMKNGKPNISPNGNFQPWKDAAKKTSSGAIPLKYANPEKSGLKRTVVNGDKNEFNFDLKP